MNSVTLLQLLLGDSNFTKRTSGQTTTYTMDLDMLTLAKQAAELGMLDDFTLTDYLTGTQSIPTVEATMTATVMNGKLTRFQGRGSVEADGAFPLSVTFDVQDMKSYDYTSARTYIMDEGDYYITAGTDAHNAVNNILQAKGYSVEGGDSGMVGTYHQDEFATLDTDEATGTAITNQFDDASGEGAVCLTRQNWAMMDNNGIS